ncbi:hypothetical protein F5Y03DRAFT_370259 [Xylaria venustula]|nr:hypothetical protein F5Y03DRAFT_370259 [Xylaria venustula]
MDQMDDPSRILARARAQLEALKQAGLSKNDLLALLEEDSQQQQSQQPQQQQQQPNQQQHQQPQQQQHQQQQQQHITPVTSDASTLQNFSYHDLNAGFRPPPQYRASVSTVSTVSSSSSGDSCFSTNSVRSSVSSSSNASNDSKFWCTSCNKTFKRKFDWKRHEEEFHDRSRKYPCDSCNQSFWGPNTFNQHHKSAHGCQTCPHAEMVMKPMRKRRAYGCGFCAALHGQFERHIDHVATHFENGMTKQDWSHSNVIYGLLHQHGIIEAWKALVASKHNQFTDRQPMFGWSPESTGRAHGYVENENPGQLQDLLEFFDGSKESAKKIVQLAETCVHVVFRPRSPSSSPVTTTNSVPPSSVASSGTLRHSVSRSTMREPRRSASTSVIVKPNKTVRRTASSSTPFGEQPPKAALTPVPSMTLPSSIQPHQTLGSTNNVYPSYMHAPDATPRPQPQLTIMTGMNSYADKALPPPPLDPVSPMAVDFPPFPEAHHMGAAAQPPSFLPEVDFAASDWQSFTSTLVGGLGDEPQQQQPQHHPHPHQHQHQHQHQQQQQQQQVMSNFAAQGFPMTWDDLGHFSGTPGP